MQQGNASRLAALLLALAGAALAASAVAEDVRTVSIDASEFAFEPDTIEAQAGQRLRIELVNTGTLSHNLHIDGEAVQAKTETVQKGSEASVTFTVPDSGSVRFFCNVPGHKQAGMTGKVVVQ